MLNLNYGKSGIAGAIALLMGITAISPFHNLKPANAQLLPRPSQNYSPVNTSVTIPAGTRIPMDFQNGEIPGYRTQQYLSNHQPHHQS